MTIEEKIEKEHIILNKMVEDLAELKGDMLTLMTKVCDTPEKIQRWKETMKILDNVDNDFTDYLLVKSFRDPIYFNEEEAE